MSNEEKKGTKFPKAAAIYVVLMIIAIALVVWICGIKGNNSQNFYYKGDKVCEITSPRKPNPTKETPPKKGLNIVIGKVVIKAA